jgi:cytochrome d ubiquinol oxidase subunit I
VPLSIGLAFFTAIFQTAWYRTQDEGYLRLTKFWGKLFLVNFALGVVTGIVQEFQFGMNWSDYSRFVGDVFGAPLAIEGLAAFFLESTFLGLWIFGWNRLSPRIHLLSIWMVAIGTCISAFFILAANAWMQHPVGYTLNPLTGRAEMTDIMAMFTNPTLWAHFPHTIAAALTTGGMFVLGVSAWHLWRERDVALFRRSAATALVVTLVSAVVVAFSGHLQAQIMTEQQPMKMAAAEALWDTESGADFSLFAIGDTTDGENIIDISLPNMLSVLATDSWNGTVEGMNDLQARYEAQYGTGSYIPIVWIQYWSFRLMTGAGFAMIAICAIGLWLLRTDRLETTRWYLILALPAIALPYLANTLGWIFTEMGRQPWVVYGILRTEDAVSPTVGIALVLTTVVGFTVIYGFLSVVDVILLRRFSRADPPAADAAPRLVVY